MQNKVKYLRRSEEFDITQEQLAKELGVSRHTIIELENGSRVPSGELMLKICNFFNRDAREIFFIGGVASNLQKNKDGIVSK